MFNQYYITTVRMSAPHPAQGSPAEVDLELVLVPCKEPSIGVPLLLGWLLLPGLLERTTQLLKQPKPGVVLVFDLDGTLVHAMNNLGSGMTCRNFQRFKNEWLARER